MTGPSGLFASQHYVDRRGVPAHLEDLEHHDLSAFGKPWAHRLPTPMGPRKIGVDLSGDDLLTNRTFVARGLGIGFLPAFFAEPAAAGARVASSSLATEWILFRPPHPEIRGGACHKFITFAAASVKRLHLHPWPGRGIGSSGLAVLRAAAQHGRPSQSAVAP